ncbi:MAG: hypothetical protein M3320_05010 [Actinomycetota bacterium]|nr:hypothetical protein [Actinomycetota bacterium]
MLDRRRRGLVRAAQLCAIRRPGNRVHLRDVLFAQLVEAAQGRQPKPNTHCLLCRRIRAENAAAAGFRLTAGAPPVFAVLAGGALLLSITCHPANLRRRSDSTRRAGAQSGASAGVPASRSHPTPHRRARVNRDTDPPVAADLPSGAP